MFNLSKHRNVVVIRASHNFQHCQWRSGVAERFRAIVGSDDVHTHALGGHPDPRIVANPSC